jgi:hypothetical protein
LLIAAAHQVLGDQANTFRHGPFLPKGEHPTLSPCNRVTLLMLISFPNSPQGKFYELYENDAEIGHAEFDLKLTDRVKMKMVSKWVNDAY